MENSGLCDGGGGGVGEEWCVSGGGGASWLVYVTFCAEVPPEKLGQKGCWHKILY